MHFPTCLAMRSSNFRRKLQEELFRVTVPLSHHVREILFESAKATILKLVSPKLRL